MAFKPVILLKTPAEFRARAIECDEIARKQTKPSEQEAWAFTAYHWRLLADYTEARRARREANAMASVPRERRG
jgi:hypothetical protein